MYDVKIREMRNKVMEEIMQLDNTATYREAELETLKDLMFALLVTHKSNDCKYSINVKHNVAKALTFHLEKLQRIRWFDV